MEGDKVVLRDRHSLCGFVIMGGPIFGPFAVAFLYG